MTKGYTPPKPRALIDLDGTLVNFSQPLRDAQMALLAPGEAPLLEADDEEKYPHVKARRRLIKNQPGFWQNLPRLERGFRVVKIMSEVGFRLTVLTRGPRPNLNAWTEKALWVRQQPELQQARTIVMDDEKAMVYGRVLMDDWIPYIEPWLKKRPRGWVILPDQPWNQGFTHPRVLRHTDNDGEVLALLIDQHARVVPEEDDEDD